MIVLIYGSFGVGKSTVARLLHRGIARSAVYNPEWVGSVLIRLPRFVRLRGAGTDDFQDVDLWRRSVVAGVRLVHSVARRPVIVPMAFSRRDYFDEIVAGLTSVDPAVRVFCLRASMATILHRLGRRSRAGSDTWSVRKAEICVAAHQDEQFGEPIETEQTLAREVAHELLRRLGPPYSPPN